MSRYDYECKSCGRTYEVQQRISAAPLTSCQYCHGPIHRLLAAAPFILKGRGWYVTDYPSESRKKAMESEKKGASTSSDVAAAPAGAATTSPSTGSGGSSTEGAAGTSSTSGSSASAPSSTTPTKP